MVQQNLRQGVFKRWYQNIEQRTVSALARPEIKKLDTRAATSTLRAELHQRESFAVAVLSEGNQKLLGASTKVVRLSDDDAIKQVISRQRQDLKPQDYYLAQQTIDQAQLVIKQSETYTVWVREGRQWYQAVLQRTRTGDEVFLKSFRRSSRKDAAREIRTAARTKSTVIKNEL